eukprot:114983_1
MDDAQKELLKEFFANSDDMSTAAAFLINSAKTFCAKLRNYTKEKINLGTSRRIFSMIKKLLPFIQFLYNIEIDIIEADYHHITTWHVINGDENSVKNIFLFFNKLIHYDDSSATIDQIKCKSAQQDPEHNKTQIKRRKF